MELYNEPTIQHPSFNDLTANAQKGTIIQPRIVGALEVSPDGIAVLGDRNIILDAVKKRIIVNDGTNDRVIIGDDTA